MNNNLLGFSDDGGNSRSSFRKDGIGVEFIQVNVGGDIKARHVVAASRLLYFFLCVR